MFINNFDPVAIQIFSFEIRWYSLAYITGILLGWFLSKRFFIENLEIKEKFDDFIISNFRYNFRWKIRLYFIL